MNETDQDKAGEFDPVTKIMDLPPAASTDGAVDNEYGTCALSYMLDVNSVIKSVQDDCAGATVTFIGDEFTMSL